VCLDRRVNPVLIEKETSGIAAGNAGIIGSSPYDNFLKNYDGVFFIPHSTLEK
jgi:hypothetical protein